MKTSIISILVILLTACMEDLSLDSNLHPAAGESSMVNLAAENPSVLTSTDIHFESEGWEDVFKIAKKERKPIFIYGYAAWCAPCLQANRTLLVDPTIVEYFNSNFISMNFEMETVSRQQVSDAWTILREYEIQLEAYPLFLFFNSKGKLVSQLHGVPDVVTLSNEAQKALDDSKEKLK